MPKNCKYMRTNDHARLSDTGNIVVFAMAVSLFWAPGKSHALKSFLFRKCTRNLFLSIVCGFFLFVFL